MAEELSRRAFLERTGFAALSASGGVLGSRRDPRAAGTGRHSAAPALGLPFLAFAPASDFFRRLRLAMDGRYADGTALPLAPRSPRLGMNGVVTATHRQNFLVPPRRRRSFPLTELL